MPVPCLEEKETQFMPMRVAKVRLLWVSVVKTSWPQSKIHLFLVWESRGWCMSRMGTPQRIPNQIRTFKNPDKAQGCYLNQEIGKLSIPGRERHAVSCVSVTRSLTVREKAEIPFEPCRGRRPSRGDIQGHSSASQKVVNKTESSGQTNASNHSSLHCHLAELQGTLGHPK